MTPNDCPHTNPMPALALSLDHLHVYLYFPIPTLGMDVQPPSRSAIVVLVRKEHCWFSTVAQPYAW